MLFNQSQDADMYQIQKSPTGKWIVNLHGSVVYVAGTKKKAQEYVDKVVGKTVDTSTNQ